MNRVFNELSQLTVYNKLNKDPLLARLKKARVKGDPILPGELLLALIQQAENNNITGDIWQNYVLELILTAENPFTLACERKILSPGQSLYQAAYHDLQLLKKLLSYKTKDILTGCENLPGYQNLDFIVDDYRPASLAAADSNTSKDRLETKKDYRKVILQKLKKDIAEGLASLMKFYNKQGAGSLNKYRAFFWDEEDKLVPVKNFDAVSWSDLVGYERQKKQLIENTRAFLAGEGAHNVLLYGESGTGKSSSVKAVVNSLAKEGLRLVEIDGEQIKELPRMLEYFNQRGLYFIIFMDDLSFAEFETEYKYLKRVMEGGIEARPKNVLFYATSNRQHLIEESWQAREDEVHEKEMINERLSLSERFGLTILFSSPNQKEYLKIVKELAAQEEITMPASSLEKKALEWEKWHRGQSGRTARQFIDYLKTKK